MKTVINKTQLPISVIIRCGNDLNGLLRCINSIDEQVEVVASVSLDAKFVSEISKNPKIIVATHQYGNWSVAAENGIKKSTNNFLIIMDSDSIFTKGAIRKIHEALLSGNIIVQPKIKFLTTSSPISRVIANSRSFENQYEPRAYSPGLGLNKKELINKIGIDGCIYNSQVMFADDGNIDKRAKENGINIFVEKSAVICHDPVTLKHETITAYRLGIGDHQGETKTQNLLYPIIKNFITQDIQKYFACAFKQYGWKTGLFILFWRTIYIVGYYRDVVSPLNNRAK